MIDGVFIFNGVYFSMERGRERLGVVWVCGSLGGEGVIGGAEMEIYKIRQLKGTNRKWKCDCKKLWINQLFFKLTLTALG